jgi:hypothetical protein
MDTYTVKQTALALSVTEKRVRQIIKEGKLKQVGSDPVTVAVVDVLELRSKREQSDKVQEARGKRDRDLVSSIELLIRQTTDSQVKAISALEEASKRNEENFLSQIAELKAENAELRKKAEGRKGFFRRG